MGTRDVRIKTVLNGWILQVGCQRLVYTDLGELLKDVKKYLASDEPEKIEQEVIKLACNAKKLKQDNNCGSAGGSTGT